MDWKTIRALLLLRAMPTPYGWTEAQPRAPSTIRALAFSLSLSLLVLLLGALPTPTGELGFSPGPRKSRRLQLVPGRPGVLPNLTRPITP